MKDELWQAWNDAFHSRISDGLRSLPPETHEKVIEIIGAAEMETHEKTTSAEIYDYGSFVLFRSVRLGDKGTPRLPFAVSMHVSDARRLRDELTRVLKSAAASELDK